MSYPTIEAAKVYDLPILNQISVASKMHWNYPIEWLHQWIDTLRMDKEYLANNHVYKLKTDRIIGFCAISVLSGNPEITHLWILPEYIGKGYGKYLLMETMKTVIKEKSEVYVEADPYAEKFYENMGFKTYDQKESYPKGRFLPLMKRMFP